MLVSQSQCTLWKWIIWWTCNIFCHWTICGILSLYYIESPYSTFANNILMHVMNKYIEHEGERNLKMEYNPKSKIKTCSIMVLPFKECYFFSWFVIFCTKTLSWQNLQASCKVGNATKNCECIYTLMCLYIAITPYWIHPVPNNANAW